MDEIDDIWELDMFGSGAYWIPQDEYIKIRAALLAGNISEKSIQFNTIDGAEIIVPLSAISDLSHTTRKQRESARTVSKQYKEQEGTKNKESWE